MKNDIRIAFFGTPQIAVWVLDELKKAKIFPSLIITNPDAPQGRNMLLTQTAVAVWADHEKIPVLKPQTLNEPSCIEALKKSGCNFFIVTAYGKIIPNEILAIPQYRTLNVHPSLLPTLRGPSPIRSAILEDIYPVGVTIMELTTGVDEGPIISQKEVSIDTEMWPLRGRELDSLLAKAGGKLLVDTIPAWVQGTYKATEQNHKHATYSKKITKDMGRIDLMGDPYKNFLKIRAFDGWPGTFCFMKKNGKIVRLKILDAEYQNGTLKITRIVPEGRKETSFESFMSGEQ